MDLRWLTAEEQEVEAAIEELDEDSRPRVEGRSSMLGVIPYILLPLYFAVVWFGFANSIHAENRPRVAPGAVSGLVINMVIITVLWYATNRLTRWLQKPRRDEQVRAWRGHLTGMVNNVDIEPVRRATFVSLITGDRRTARCEPRFSAPGVEFGNLTSRAHSVLEWHYLAVELPAPLPHLILESTAAGSLPKELGRAENEQPVPTGYPFDRTFTVHAPPGYEHDALYVLTPAVKAVLLDHAADFHIETIGDTLVFFAPEHADFAEPATWQAIDALWMNAVPVLMTRATRYRDERVPEQAFSQRLLTFQQAVTTPGYTWERPDRSIAPRGRRQARQQPRLRWSMVRKYGGEYVIVWLVMGPFLLAGVSVVLTAVRLYEAFVGG